MSIILKGIDLPPNAKVELIVKSPTERFRKQIPKSKVIQIPKDHGRIVDVGGVRKELNEMLVEGETFVTAVEFAKLTIDNAPTILESEE